MRRKIGLTFATLVLLLTVSSMMLAQGEDYVVEPGDTLDVVAQSFNVSAACIAEASDLPNPNVLSPGDSLVIPADCPPYDGLFIFLRQTNNTSSEDQGGGATTTSGQGGGSSGGDYTVGYGDVLDVIAQQFDASVACIAEASDLTDPHRLRPGDTLVIPSNCPPYDGLFIFREPADDDDQGGGATTTTSGQGGGNSYTIEYGDVLDVIAQQFDVSVTCLAEASDIADINKVRPGDTLVIDAGCPPYDGLFFQPDVETDGAAG